MIADIFYPIFTPTITVLICFVRKKNKKQNCLSALYLRLQEGITLDTLWGGGRLTAPPRPPAAIIFGFSKNRYFHIFSVLSPGYVKVCVNKFCSDKINVTKNVFFFPLPAPIHRSFSFNLRFLYELKVRLSKTVWGFSIFDSVSFLSKFIFLFNQML